MNSSRNTLKAKYLKRRINEIHNKVLLNEKQEFEQSVDKQMLTKIDGGVDVLEKILKNTGLFEVPSVKLAFQKLNKNVGLFMNRNIQTSRVQRKIKEILIFLDTFISGFGSLPKVYKNLLRTMGKEDFEALFELKPDQLLALLNDNDELFKRVNESILLEAAPATPPSPPVPPPAPPPPKVLDLAILTKLINACKSFINLSNGIKTISNKSQFINVNKSIQPVINTITEFITDTDEVSKLTNKLDKFTEVIVDFFDKDVKTLTKEDVQNFHNELRTIHLNLLKSVYGFFKDIYKRAVTAHAKGAKSPTIEDKIVDDTKVHDNLTKLIKDFKIGIEKIQYELSPPTSTPTPIPKTFDRKHQKTLNTSYNLVRKLFQRKSAGVFDWLLGRHQFNGMGRAIIDNPDQLTKDIFIHFLSKENFPKLISTSKQVGRIGDIFSGLGGKGNIKKASNKARRIALDIEGESLSEDDLLAIITAAKRAAKKTTTP
jgi:hypothetical protein